MNPNKALWEKGDFARMAVTMRDSGAALAADLGVTEGMRVLDLGCGDGTTAVPEAQLGADVLGVDIAENLVAAGNARAQKLGLDNLRFQEGDASHLDELDDASFDLVVSIFGAMFAPKPFDVAKEMVRVTKPGGRIDGVDVAVRRDVNAGVGELLAPLAAFDDRAGDAPNRIDAMTQAPTTRQREEPDRTISSEA